MREPRTLLVLGLLIVVVLLACNKKREGASGEDGGSGTNAGNDAGQYAGGGRPASEHDPCSLLEARDVAEVTGPLAGPPFRTKEGLDDPVPTEDGDACAYQTPDFRTIIVSITWTDGATALKAFTLPSRMIGGTSGTAETAEDAKNAAKKLLISGVQVEGDWDEAAGFGCCEIYALRGDSLINFDFRGWGPDTKRAMNILNKALSRLEHPLSVNGNAGNDAALKRAALRPQPRSVCALLSRTEVESVLGKLAANPHPSSKDPNQDCVYRFIQAESKESTLKDAPAGFKSFVGALTGGRTGLVQGAVDTAITIKWRGGFRQLSDTGMVAGAVTANYAGLPGMPKRTEGKVEGGPWDEATQNGLNFTAVKKDVAVMIDSEPMLSEEQVELRRKLVAKLITKL